jgi:SAM-dependent methyltransferase
MSLYLEDLAWIHDAGFTGYALNAAPGLLRLLRRSGASGGLAVDLGCGSGRWARELNRAGYRVLGVDSSPAFLRLARRIAPRSRFAAASLWTFPLPPCDAVTSIGECLNYATGARRNLPRLFARIYAALRPGGVFLFDVAGPSRILDSAPHRHWTEGDGWAVLVESQGDPMRLTLTRRIVCYRRMGSRYRRTAETHRLQLYRPADILRAFAGTGFHAETLASYGRFRLPPGIDAFLALKPKA